MSDRVILTNERLREYASVSFQTEATEMALELLESRATLAKWQALVGESPESVRAELERLRHESLTRALEADAARDARHLATQLSPLEALEEAVDAVLGPYVAPSAVKVGELRDIVRRARRAAGEVL